MLHISTGRGLSRFSAVIQTVAKRAPSGETFRLDQETGWSIFASLRTIWPVDDGRDGLDATFQGGTGYQRAQQHQRELERDGVPHTFRQELDGAWTLRFGPLPAADIARALSAFVY